MGYPCSTLNGFRLRLWLGFCSLSLGSSIYLLWRSRQLLVFKLIDWIGYGPYIDQLRSWSLSLLDPQECLDDTLTDWLLYCLPDGLWSIAYMLCIDAWALSKLPHANYSLYIRSGLISICPLSGIITELMQGIGWLGGTYDWRDLFCYSIPLFIYLISIWTTTNKKKAPLTTSEQLSATSK